MTATIWNPHQLSLFGESIAPDVHEHACPTCHGRGVVTRTGPISSAPARDSDPETSHAASEHELDIRRFSARSRQAAALAMIDRTPSTALEVAMALVPAATVSIIEGCRRRVSDLVAAGMIQDSGIRRANPGSPDLAIVWEITITGALAIQSLADTGWSR